MDADRRFQAASSSEQTVDVTIDHLTTDVELHLRLRGVHGSGYGEPELQRCQEGERGSEGQNQQGEEDPAIFEPWKFDWYALPPRSKRTVGTTLCWRGMAGW